MEFQAKDSFGRKFKGKGELHVSTIRMVFIKDSASADFSAFDLPMANISNEKFNQPIFGANNMTGTVAAVRPPCSPLPCSPPPRLSADIDDH